MVFGNQDCTVLPSNKTRVGMWYQQLESDPLKSQELDTQSTREPTAAENQPRKKPVQKRK